MNCPMCGGPGVFMGAMGYKTWFRCRNCGMEFARDETPQEKPKKKRRKR